MQIEKYRISWETDQVHIFGQLRVIAKPCKFNSLLFEVKLEDQDSYFLPKIGGHTKNISTAAYHL